MTLGDVEAVVKKSHTKLETGLAKMVGRLQSSLEECIAGIADDEHSPVWTLLRDCKSLPPFNSAPQLADHVADLHRSNERMDFLVAATLDHKAEQQQDDDMASFVGTGYTMNLAQELERSAWLVSGLGGYRPASISASTGSHLSR
jgi:hypothetical protein